MGLTIHYQLKHKDASVAAARDRVEQIRRRAMDLPFQEVGHLIELRGDRCDFEKVDKHSSNRWLLIQARESVERGPYCYEVRPTHLIAFSTLPGEGCEPANFGLCRYPATIEVDDHASQPPRRRRLRTDLAGWSWRSSCKTQYASNPAHGGVENFLRCHLLVARMLELAGELGILSEVRDEGGYWEKRDPQALVQMVGEWNQMIAAQFGKLKDQMGGAVGGAIQQFPNFEHLEATGNREQDPPET